MKLYEICERKLYYFGYAKNTIKTYLGFIDEKIAGHKSSKTTEIYTHVSNNLIQQVNSPI